MTLYIALWGAGLGTLTFIWNIVRWRQERPCVQATVETVESLYKENSYGGVRLTLRNRGGKKTTIEGIRLYRRQGWFEFGLVGVLNRMRGDLPWSFNVGAANSNTIELPKVLDVNQSWEGFIPFQASEDKCEAVLRQVDHNSHILEVLRTGELRYSIQCSHTNRRLRGLVGQENPWPRE